MDQLFSEENRMWTIGGALLLLLVLAGVYVYLGRSSKKPAVLAPQADEVHEEPQVEEEDDELEPYEDNSGGTAL